MVTTSKRVVRSKRAFRWLWRVPRRVKSPTCYVLAYHSVSARRSPFIHDCRLRHQPAEFERHLEYLAECCHPVSVAALLEHLRSGNLPEQAVVLTFDDGYADVVHTVAPMLHRWRIPATAFVVTGVVGNVDLLWQHKLTWLLRNGHEGAVERAMRAFGMPVPNGIDNVAGALRSGYRPDVPEMLEWALMLVGTSGRSLAGQFRPYVEVRDLEGADSNRLDFGNHTRTHPVLAALSREEQGREVLAGYQDLARLCCHPPIAFAYPFGLKDQIGTYARECVGACGHRAAFDLCRRQNDAATDAMCLSRLPVPVGSPRLLRAIIEG